MTKDRSRLIFGFLSIGTALMIAGWSSSIRTFRTALLLGSLVSFLLVLLELLGEWRTQTAQQVKKEETIGAYRYLREQYQILAAA